MKRKVNRVGTNTLTVSLPSKWVKENKIEPGQELSVSLEKQGIIFSLKERRLQGKEITLDISNFNKYLLSRYLEVLYITNYNKIILTHSTSEIHNDKEKKDINLKGLIRFITNRFIGMEIVSQTKNMTELQCFLLDEEKDLNKIEKRIYFLFKDAVEEFLESLEGSHAEFHANVYHRHDSISKFTNYYLRVLDQSNKSEDEEKQLYSLYLIIDKMLDKFRHLSEMVDKYGCTMKVKRLLIEIFDLVSDLFTALHKGKISRELVTKRYALVRKIESQKFTLEELKVINEVKIFLDMINDFTRAVIVKEIARAP